MSYRTLDRLMFVVMVVMAISQSDRINVWQAYPIGWAFGRWLADVLEMWEEGEDV